MTINTHYFSDCTTVEEIKKLYKRLAFENHPDRGGDTETMQKINAEYAYRVRVLASNSGKTFEENEQTILAAEAYKEAIEKIIHLPGIKIEVVGFWIWVTGQTKPVKETLKEARYIWAHKKEAWYFRTEQFKTRNRSKMTLDQIRRKYGSETINGRQYRNVDEKAA